MANARLRIVLWNQDQIMAQAERLTREYVTAVENALDVSISAWNYDWPRATKRRNGQLVQAGLRNIVDTGYLRNSRVTVHSYEGATISYNTPYADYVFFGTDRTPGRDWITPAYASEPGPPLEFFIERWR